MSYVLLDDQESGRQMLFEDPKYLITAHGREELDAAFVAIESAQAEGYWLAGWTAYELGHALETHFDAPDAAPLIHLGVFDAPKTNVPVETLYTRDVPRLEFLPDWSEDDYLIRFEKLQQYLRSGDCYQINLTFPMQAQSDATPAQIDRQGVTAQWLLYPTLKLSASRLSFFSRKLVITCGCVR